MLFSHEQLVTRLERDFECAWQSVRPVPRVTIDFGDGRRLDRTLHGNVALWLCDPQGRALDIVPGLITPDELMARLDALDARAPGRFRPAAGVAPSAVQDLGKARVEDPLKAAFGAPVRQVAPIPDIRKRIVETPVEGGMGKTGILRPDRGAASSGLDADSAYNRAFRDPLVAALLRRTLGARPTPAFTGTLFREVLGVDLDDPWLGLAPYVLGGELGRAGG